MKEIYQNLEALEKHLEEMKADDSNRTINPIHAIYCLVKEVREIKNLCMAPDWKVSAENSDKFIYAEYGSILPTQIPDESQVSLKSEEGEVLFCSCGKKATAAICSRYHDDTLLCKDCFGKGLEDMCQKKLNP